ncbi:MAG TPA: CotH kinase family protein [Planctomycetota bacterium]|nr:CotH kinase family protein [Planctomycetota bacterium]
MTPGIFAVLLVAAASPAPPQGKVVINEIFYHAPDDLDDLQWIELHNPGDGPADLSRWILRKSIEHRFPDGTTLAAGGYLVLARNGDRFREHYGAAADGVFEKGLSRSGGRIELCNAAGELVDAARYKDEPPWPVSADGYSASLERICPGAPAEDAGNWAASPLPVDAPKPSGTPGRRNAAFRAVLPPVVVSVGGAGDLAPAGQPLAIEAEVKDKGALGEVRLLYRVVAAGVEGAEASVAMAFDAAAGRFRAEIPPQAADTIVRYRVKAASAAGAVRLYPDENDLRPTLSTYVHDRWPAAGIPFGFVIRTGVPQAAAPDAARREPRRPGGPGDFPRGPGDFPRGPGDFPRGPGDFPRGPGDFPRGPGDFPRGPGDFPRGESRGGPPDPRAGPGGFRPPPFGPMGRSETRPPRPPRGSSAFLYVDHATGKASFFDHIHVVERDGDRGYKLHFHKDRRLDGMSVASLVFEGNERFLLAEALSYDVYRRAGNAACRTEFVRLWVDGRQRGYHLMIEQPNRAFLRRNGLDDRGNLYKIRWFRRGIEGQHEKRTNTRGSHADLTALIGQLESTAGDEQWQVIRENFNVEQTATYFAVNMVLSHWDGFFNNYFAYHDTRGTNKWEMYPWDQDKAWGYHDALRGEEVFYDMPLTFGMEGDRAPGQRQAPAEGPRFGNPGGPGPFGGGPPGGMPPGGGTMWWRPGGYFSRPLLANPRFRAVFLARTKEIAEKIYTPELYFPLIDALADRLREDARLFAELRGEDPEAGERRLARNVKSLRDHVVERRRFLLDQAELRAAGAPAAEPKAPASAGADPR